MARKTADKIPSLSMTPLEQAWAAYEEAQREYDEHWASYIKLFDDKRESGWRKGVTRESMAEMDKRLDRLLAQNLRSFDTWNRLRKRQADTSLSNVDRESVHVLVAEEFTEAAGEMQWKPNYGLAAHRLVEALMRFTVREESQEVPLCLACA